MKILDFGYSFLIPPFFWDTLYIDISEENNPNTDLTNIDISEEDDPNREESIDKGDEVGKVQSRSIGYDPWIIFLV